MPVIVAQHRPFMIRAAQAPAFVKGHVNPVSRSMPDVLQLSPTMLADHRKTFVL
jgi:hypothetical protein